MASLRTAARASAWVVASGILALPVLQAAAPMAGGTALAASALTVRGDVQGLEPGRTGRLVLTVDNGDAEPAAVTALQVLVSGGTPACGADALTVVDWAGLLEVPAHGSASQAVEVRVRADAACEGVGWKLGYTAQTA